MESKQVDKAAIPTFVKDAVQKILKEGKRRYEGRRLTIETTFDEPGPRIDESKHFGSIANELMLLKDGEEWKNMFIDWKIDNPLVLSITCESRTVGNDAELFALRLLQFGSREKRGLFSNVIKMEIINSSVLMNFYMISAIESFIKSATKNEWSDVHVNYVSNELSVCYCEKREWEKEQPKKPMITSEELVEYAKRATSDIDEALRDVLRQNVVFEEKRVKTFATINQVAEKCTKYPPGVLDYYRERVFPSRVDEYTKIWKVVSLSMHGTELHLSSA